MKENKRTSVVYTNPKIRNFLFSILVTSAAVSSVTAGESPENYYENTLLNPGGHTLRAESKGRVTIYDGLDSKLVDHALDTQFERIGSMMFVRTRVVLDDGGEEVDDDCDD